MKRGLMILFLIIFVLSGCVEKEKEDKKEVLPEITKVSLLGTVNNAPDDAAWDLKNKDYDMENKGNGIYEKTIRINGIIATWIASNVSEANYAFKIVANGAWAGRGGIEYGAKENNVLLKSDGNVFRTMNSGEAYNIYVKLEKGAQYKFTLDSNKMTLKIEKTGEPLNSDATLKSLLVKEIKLNREFTPDVYEYLGETDGEFIEIEAAANKSEAKTSGVGKKNLVIGKNNFMITVVAENGIDKKEYKITIDRKYTSPYEKLEQAKTSFTAINLKEVNSNIDINANVITISSDKLTLPSVYQGIEVTWFSENQSVLSNEGIVTRPEYEQGDKKFKIFAVLKISSKTIIKEFNIVVKAKSELSIKKVSLLGTINGIGDDAWAILNSKYEMTDKGAGIFEKTVRIPKEIATWITVSGANYAFKFTANGAWANNEGTGGIEYGFPQDNKLGDFESTLLKTRTVDPRAFNVYVKLIPGSEYKFVLDSNKSKYTIVKTGDPLDGDNSLKLLEIENSKLTPAFSSSALKYDITVGRVVQKIKIKVEPAEKVTEAVDGIIYKDITPGQNLIKIVVKAEDGTTKEYTIVVLRNKAEKVTISQTETTIEINGSYKLPASAKMILTDGTTEEYKLIWDEKEVIKSKAGVYYAKAFISELNEWLLYEVNVINSNVSDKEKLDNAINMLTLGNITEAKYDLILPSTINGIPINWKSSDTNYMKDDGRVNRPSFEAGDKIVKLTATLTLNKESVSKVFTLNIPKIEKVVSTDSEKLKEAKDALDIGNLVGITNNILLPLNKYEAQVLWSSSNENIVTSGGKVTRPANGEGNGKVILTATLKVGTVTDTKEFTVIVLEQTPSVKDEDVVKKAKEHLTIEGDLTNITKDIILLKEIDGAKVTWKSNNSAIDNTGKVTRPSISTGNISGTLIATIIYGSSSDTKVFSTTVTPKDLTENEKLANAKANLTIPGNLTQVVTNLTLRTEQDGAIVTWSSQKPEILSTNGIVVRPQYKDGDAPIKLTATLTYGSAKDYKEFSIIVIKRDPNKDAALADLKINGATISDFAKDKEIYTYSVDSNAAIPLVSVKLSDANGKYIVTNAAKIPGETRITVTAEDGVTVKNYIISFILKASSDASLTEIKINDTALSGFKTDYYEYNYELPANSKDADIKCLTSYGNAKYEIIKPTNIPGQAKITVTAEDGKTQKIYRINLTAALLSSKKILNFVLKGNNVNGIINEASKTIMVTLPYGTNVTALTPSVDISEKANIVPASGVVQNFTNPVLYKVTAEDGSFTVYTVTVALQPNSEKKIQEFKVNSFIVNLDEVNKVVTIKVPYGTDISNLVPEIKISDKANITPASGAAQNFVNSVKYIVTAQDGTKQEYIVKVEIGKNSEKKITLFKFLNPAVDGTIDEANKKITLTVPYGTNINNIIPDIKSSDRSAVFPASGIAQNFASSLNYTVTAEDGTYNVYAVTVIVEKPKSSEKGITLFKFINPAVTGIIDETNKKIDVTVPYGTILTQLTAQFTIKGVSIKVLATEQVSGTTVNDFTKPVIYTVTAEDGTSLNYTVTVTPEKPKSSTKSINSFKFTTPLVIGTIDEINKKIDVTVPYGTNITQLIAQFSTNGISVKVGITEQVSGTSANDFTKPVVYTVTAEDGTKADYTVTVKIQPNSEKKIVTFNIANPALTGTIDEINKKITLTVPYGTNRTAIIPTIKVSDKGTVSPASGVAQNFTNPVVYTVTAEDGTSITYTVNITEQAKPKSGEKSILSFNLTNPAFVGTIEELNKKISITVPYGTNRINIIPEIKVSDKSIVSPASGVAQNFTNPVVYTVTAEDGTAVTYTVFVAEEAKPKSSEKGILSFGFTNPVVTGTIDEANKKIDLTVPNGTNVAQLTAQFLIKGISIKIGGAEQISGTTVNNFTNSIIYTIMAEDGTTVNYTVSVKIAPPITTEITYNITKGELILNIFRVYNGSLTVNNDIVSKIEVYSSNNLISELPIAGRTGTVNFMVSENTSTVTFVAKDSSGNTLKSEDKQVK